MPKAFKTFNHGKGRIMINNINKMNIIALRPTELHLKTNGSIKEEPSFAIVMESPLINTKAIGEISLEMLNEGFNELGYQLVKL